MVVFSLDRLFTEWLRPDPSWMPPSFLELLQAFQLCFTARSWRTSVRLAAGMVSRTGRRTVCEMLVGAGLANVWHHLRHTGSSPTRAGLLTGTAWCC